MTCSVYRSPTPLLTMSALLVPCLAAWAYSVLPRTDLPPVVRFGAGAVLAVALIACLIAALARRPMVRVDATGIAYRPKSFPKIDWDDVIGVERVPLIEPTPDGLINHLHDGRRPVNVFVADSARYLRRLPAGVGHRLTVDEGADSVRVQIGFVGLSPASAEVYECIRRYLDVRSSRA